MGESRNKTGSCLNAIYMYPSTWAGIVSKAKTSAPASSRAATLGLCQFTRSWNKILSFLKSTGWSWRQRLSWSNGWNVPSQQFGHKSRQRKQGSVTYSVDQKKTRDISQSTVCLMGLGKVIFTQKGLIFFMHIESKTSQFEIIVTCLTKYQHLALTHKLSNSFLSLPVLSCCQHICLCIQTHHADMLRMDLLILPLASSLGIQYCYCKNGWFHLLLMWSQNTNKRL